MDATTQHAYRLDVYFDSRIHDASRQALKTLLMQIQAKWGASFNLVDADTLTTRDVTRLKNEIRSIPPQVRGRIVSAQHRALPLSNNRHLNLTNTPILLLYQDAMPVTVYPNLLGSTYTNVTAALTQLLTTGLHAYLKARGLLEHPVTKILADFPEVIEPGMTYVDSEIEVGVGNIDVLLRDETGNDVVVEVEMRAADQALGQVSRLAAGLALLRGTSADSIRKVIVCLDHGENLDVACHGSNVELYRIAANRVA
jgi:hypothetical protein